MKKLILLVIALLSFTVISQAQYTSPKLLEEIGRYSFGKMDTVSTTYTITSDAFGLDVKDSIAFAVEYQIIDSTTRTIWEIDSIMVNISDTLKFAPLPFSAVRRASTYTTIANLTTGWVAGVSPEGCHVTKGMTMNYGYLKGGCQIVIVPKSGKFPVKWRNRTLRVILYKISR